MTELTEKARAAGFILSEANGQRSRDNIMIAAGEGELEAGTVVAYKTSTGKYVVYQNDETDLAAKAIIIYPVNATSADVEVAAIVRDAEVIGPQLRWANTEDTGDRDAAVADLASVGIIVRGSIDA
jgi:co-chaperonin GroES (HSP10)